MIKRVANTFGVFSIYICLSPWCRLIFLNGHYDGWYNPRLKKVLD